MNFKLLPGPEGAGQGTWIRRVLVFYGVGLLFLAGTWLLWMTMDALLLVFAALLLAILLHELAVRLARATGISQSVSLSIVVALFLLGSVIGLWLGAARILEQSTELAAGLPKALKGIQAMIADTPVLRDVLRDVAPPERMLEKLGSVLPGAGLFFSGVLGVLTNIVVILFVAIYLAAQPQAYRHGIMMLVPPAHRKRTAEVLDELKTTLAQWLLGKAVSMIAVGAVTAIGLSLLGVPLALVLGVIAGVLDFIPYVGPILAGVPAVLMASTKSPELAGWVALLFVAIQLAEGYLLLPLVEKRSVDLPPALTLTMQVMLGSIFGMAGIALATPLAAVIAVVVTMLYVQDVLHVPASTPGNG